jgi:hypothetical protein
MALTYNRMTVYTLARHLSTSVAMIEQHNGHVELRRIAHEIESGRGYYKDCNLRRLKMWILVFLVDKLTTTDYVQIVLAKKRTFFSQSHESATVMLRTKAIVYLHKFQHLRICKIKI